MKIKFVAGIAGVLLFFGVIGVSQAALMKIGQGIHWDGINRLTTSNLIWDTDTDLNGDSLIWLDYSAPQKSWDAQVFWVQGLDSMIITLDSGYTVDWGANSWRLPDSHNQDGTGPDGEYNVTGSEMGHLYYTELNNSAYGPLTNTGEFQNLVASWYWSGTEVAGYTGNAWVFNMYGGFQYDGGKSNGLYGLAVRSGQVSAVPVPGGIWLIGSGLVGLVGLQRRRTENRV